jgi:hypothetical protein
LRSELRKLRSQGWSWAKEGRDSTVNHNFVWLTNNLVRAIKSGPLPSPGEPAPISAPSPTTPEIGAVIIGDELWPSSGRCALRPKKLLVGYRRLLTGRRERNNYAGRYRFHGSADRKRDARRLRLCRQLQTRSYNR